MAERSWVWILQLPIWEPPAVLKIFGVSENQNNEAPTDVNITVDGSNYLGWKKFCFKIQKLYLEPWKTQLASSAICSWERPIFCKVTRLFLVFSADICSRKIKNSKTRNIYIIIQEQPISFFYILYYLILNISQNGLQHSNRASFISLSVKPLFTS